MKDRADKAAERIARQLHAESDSFEVIPEQVAEWAAFIREEEADVLRRLSVEFHGKLQDCIAKAHDSREVGDWDAYMNKASAYADCAKAVQAELAILDGGAAAGESDA